MQPKLATATFYDLQGYLNYELENGIKNGLSPAQAIAYARHQLIKEINLVAQRWEDNKESQTFVMK